MQKNKKMDSIKEAFSKVKQDIFYLGEELNNIKNELIELKTELKLISNFIEDIKIKQIQQTNRPTQTPTIQHINSNTSQIPTDNPTLPSEIIGLLSPNNQSSIGNQGVPTNKQTNQQTNQHIIPTLKIQEKSIKKPIDNTFDKATEILSNLDNIRKEVRIKFKRLTQQEMQVFSVLYSLEEQGEEADFKLISEKMNLSESSIREYILKLQRKGIPITKEKLNNKRVILHISQDLKKIASLSTIMQLREL